MTRSPSATRVPAMSASRVAVRNKLLSGVTQRMSSSTAAGDQRRIGRHRFPVVGMLREFDEPARDDSARRLRAAGDEQAGLLHDDLVAHRAAVELARSPRSPNRSSALAPRRCSTSGSSTALNSVMAPIMSMSLSWSVSDRVDAHQPLRPTPHRLPLIVAEAEKVRGELGGERRREFVDEFHLAAFGDRRRGVRRPPTRSPVRGVAPPWA